MSIGAMERTFELENVTATEKLILLCLANYADDEARAWPKQTTLARMTGLARETINRTLAELNRRGIIQKTTIGTTKEAVCLAYIEPKSVTHDHIPPSQPQPKSVTHDHRGVTDDHTHYNEENRHEPKTTTPLIPKAPTTNPPKKERRKPPAFKKPAIEDIKAYCLERKNSVDPEKFFNHYEANGWRVGRNPMKDWRAAVRTWEKSEFNGLNGGGGGRGPWQRPTPTNGVPSSAETRRRLDEELSGELDRRLNGHLR